VTNLVEELQKLQQLHQSGAINDEEFALAKARLLSTPPEPQSGWAAWTRRPCLTPETLEEQTRQWAMFLHLSVLAGLAVPLAGMVVPVVIWQLKKNELPGIDVHGKNALNWIISEVIYVLVCIVLGLAFIGLPLLIGLAAVGVIFPIIAGIKANNGEVWKYPLAINFL